MGKPNNNSTRYLVSWFNIKVIGLENINSTYESSALTGTIVIRLIYMSIYNYEKFRQILKIHLYCDGLQKF